MIWAVFVLQIIIIIAIVAYYWSISCDISCARDALTNLHKVLMNETSAITTRQMEHQSDLLSAIACLATKNNEDMKRLADGFRENDIVEIDGKEYLMILNRIYTSAGQLEGYACLNSSRTNIIWYSVEDFKRYNAKLIRHAYELDSVFVKGIDHSAVAKGSEEFAEFLSMNAGAVIAYYDDLIDYLSQYDESDGVKVKYIRQKIEKAVGKDIDWYAARRH